MLDMGYSVLSAWWLQLSCFVSTLFQRSALHKLFDRVAESDSKTANDRSIGTVHVYVHNMTCVCMMY